MSIDEAQPAPGKSSPAAGWRADFMLGLWHILPLEVGLVPFGLLMGALAAQKGFGPVEMMLMSGTVFAGASQFVALDMWRDPIPMLTIVATTAMINLRHVMMGAAMQPAMGRFNRFQAPLALFLMADEIWAMAMRRAGRGRLTPAYYFGLATFFYLSWVFWTGLGTVVGAIIRDPARYGFDFAFTAVFLILIVGLWRGRRSIAPLAASAIVALAAHAWLPGVWYIVLGGAAGVLAAALSTPEPS
ncbi:MAG TPA: AzlC family ABC transporter permease [Hypericibacter adhaerens]|jgi:4-azaleucine resistance transporter AzlC|nr:AzlC family ABC transporter permease [Hypericibacter adhaerens]HWA44745.1 AzlC family ABC transporter permease [Hypericibacter adhaerens]